MKNRTTIDLLGEKAILLNQAADLRDGQILTTLDGTKLNVTISNGTIRVGNANITTKDV